MRDLLRPLEQSCSNDMIGAEAKQDSNNDRTRWDLLDLLVEQIGAERHWIKVKQLFEYQTYFARYSICCKCVVVNNFLRKKSLKLYKKLFRIFVDSFLVFL